VVGLSWRVAAVNDAFWFSAASLVEEEVARLYTPPGLRNTGDCGTALWALPDDTVTRTRHDT